MEVYKIKEKYQREIKELKRKVEKLKEKNSQKKEEIEICRREIFYKDIELRKAEQKQIGYEAKRIKNFLRVFEERLKNQYLMIQQKLQSKENRLLQLEKHFSSILSDRSQRKEDSSQFNIDYIRQNQVYLNEILEKKMRVQKLRNQSSSSRKNQEINRMLKFLEDEYAKTEDIIQEYKVTIKKSTKDEGDANELSLASEMREGELSKENQESLRLYSHSLQKQKNKRELNEELQSFSKKCQELEQQWKCLDINYQTLEKDYEAKILAYQARIKALEQKIQENLSEFNQIQEKINQFLRDKDIDYSTKNEFNITKGLEIIIHNYNELKSKCFCNGIKKPDIPVQNQDFQVLFQENQSLIESQNKLKGKIMHQIIQMELQCGISQEEFENLSPAQCFDILESELLKKRFLDK